MTTSLATTELVNMPEGIQLIGVDQEDVESQKRIFAHATRVLHHHQQMTASAMKVCICLYQCREEFKNSGDRGWESFCEANFKQLDMQATHIRAAVRTGRALYKVISSHQIDAIPGTAEATFSRMSRFALTTFSETPEELREDLATRLIQLSETTGRAPTNRDVKEEYADLVQELEEARGHLKLKDDALSRMNAELQRADDRVNDLREQTERLNAEVRRLGEATPVNVEDADPNSKRAKKALAEVEEALAKARNDLRDAEAELLQTREKQRSLESATPPSTSDAQLLNTISAMEDELASLTKKWSPVYLAKLRTGSDPKISSRIDGIACGLESLASQLKPVVTLS